MIATIAVIAAITEKKNSAIIWKPLSGDRSDNDRWDRTFYISAIVVAAIAGKWFHMIAMIAAIAEFFFLSDRSDYSDGSDHMETGLWFDHGIF